MRIRGVFRMTRAYILSAIWAEWLSDTGPEPDLWSL
jgi:hypothetical protein